MLIPRRLDDQTFEDIMREAISRLPWLCPQWTDHNAHDPGITILELMAWYKEILQYRMDRRTPAIWRGLLALGGVQPAPAQPAVCMLETAPDGPMRPALSRLSNQQDMSFELLDPIPARTCTLTAAAIARDGSRTDVRGLLGGSIALKPFAFGGQAGSSLLLGFAGQAQAPLRLWFTVSPPDGPARSPFAPGQTPPRTLAWEFVGARAVMPQADETYALSQSGFVCLQPPADWPQDGAGLRWLRIAQTRAGCEEQPRLRAVSDRLCRAAQQQTRARSHSFTVPPLPGQTVLLTDAHAREAELAVFLRGADGWSQCSADQQAYTAAGRTLTLDASAAVQDGAPNVLVVCLDPVRLPNLLFDTIGRPGETLFLDLGGQTALPNPFQLLCQTRMPDGTVRPAVWQCTEDLHLCGPRDRVFVYDAARETVQFGNGRYGAVPVPGKGAVLVMDLVLSHCGAGNVPAGAGLAFTDDGQPVDNLAASGGCDAERLPEASERLLRMLEQTERCLTAADYARQAYCTPGLRVAAARALPGYDPDAPTSGVCTATVTVVVIPASDDPRPQPDGRFLQAVHDQLAQKRTIGMRTLVIGPRYVETDVTLRLRAVSALDEAAVRAALADVLAIEAARIGSAVRRTDLMASVQRLPDVLEVQQLELRAVSPGGSLTPSGDLNVPPDGLAVLHRIQIEHIRA